MEVRFPTYSLRELQRSAQRPEDGDDPFVQVIGALSTDTEPDMSRRSKQAETASDQLSAQHEDSGPRLRQVLGAEAIAAALERPDPDETPAAPLVPFVGETLDVRA